MHSFIVQQPKELLRGRCSPSEGVRYWALFGAGAPPLSPLMTSATRRVPPRPTTSRPLPLGRGLYAVRHWHLCCTACAPMPYSMGTKQQVVIQKCRCTEMWGLYDKGADAVQHQPPCPVVAWSTERRCNNIAGGCKGTIFSAIAPLFYYFSARPQHRRTLPCCHHPMRQHGKLRSQRTMCYFISFVLGSLCSELAEETAH